MRRTLAATVLPVVALAIAAGAVAPAPAAAAVRTRGRIGIVVRFSNGRVAAGCVAAGGSGLQVLQRAHRVAIGTAQYTGFVLQIDGKGSTRPDSTHYWSYWHAPGTGRWHYAASGAASTRPGRGTVEGWSYVSGQQHAPEPPRRTFARLCRRRTSAHESTGPGPAATAQPAAAAAPASSTPAWPVVSAATVVVVLAGAAWLIARRRRA